jgi:CheY-like chemotaxis protein
MESTCDGGLRKPSYLRLKSLRIGNKQEKKSSPRLRNAGPMPLALILSVGHHPTLLETRNLILRAAGYKVEGTASIKQAIRQIQEGNFDLVLLCHSIPAPERERLAGLIRASGASTSVVSIATITGGPEDAFVDQTIESDPRKLLPGIKEVLLKSTTKRPQQPRFVNRGASSGSKARDDRGGRPVG